MYRTEVIIVAGGTGSRMGADVPKQFLPLCGMPVIIRTVLRFREAMPEAGITVVVHPDWLEEWQAIASKYGLVEADIPYAPVRSCVGGSSRFESVKNGLEVIGECDFVMVHDAVRPLVSAGLIESVFQSAYEHGNAVPAIEPADSFRVIIPGNGTEALRTEHFDRASLRAIQTPQCFRAGILHDAYTQVYDPLFTDDASVVEKAGHAISICEGEKQNIKLTTKEDFIFAEAMIGAGVL